MKKFQKKVEDFTCENCSQFVTGNGYTNHCPTCLWSKHVDNDPGDRLATCLGLMKPIKVEKDKDNFMIVHRCEVCALEKRNRVGDKDNFDAAVALAKKYAMDVSKAGK